MTARAREAPGSSRSRTPDTGSTSSTSTDSGSTRRRTSALRLGPEHFVAFLESHDQVSNLAHSMRMHQLANPSLCRAFKGLLMLSPQTPMLFQGEEFGSTSPFPFFAGHTGDLAKAVRK